VARKFVRTHAKCASNFFESGGGEKEASYLLLFSNHIYDRMRSRLGQIIKTTYLQFNGYGNLDDVVALALSLQTLNAY
jgi:prophage maintenance system killer protein